MKDSINKISADTVLKESEARIKSIFRSAPIGIGVVSNRIILEVNDRFCEMTGYKEPELIGHNSRIVYTSDEEFERVGKYKYEQIKKFGTGSIETQFKRKDGKIIDIILSSTPIDPNDLNVGVTFTALDITERKQSEKALRDSEKKHKIYVENAPQGIFVVNLRGKYVDVNSEACQMTGYSREELLDMSIPDLGSPELASEEFNSVTGLKKKEKSDIETTLRRKDGTDFYVSLSRVALSEDLFMAFCTDITERKQKEELLQESQVFNKTLLDTSPNIIYVYDIVDRKNVYSNAGITKILGYSIEEIKKYGDNLLPDLMHPDDFKSYLKDIIPRYQSAKDEELIEHNYRMKDRNGTWHILRSQEYIFNRQDDGTPKQIFGVTYDITKRKQAEEELKESEEKYKALYNNAPLSYQSLDEKGCFLDVNPTWLSTLGYKREEVIGKCFADFLHADWKQHFEKNFPEFSRIGYVHDVQFKIRHKDGHYLDISFEGCIGYHPDGSFKQTYCTFQDITLRKQAREELSHSHDLMRYIIEHNNGAVAVHDKDLNYIYVSQSYLDQYKVKEKDIIGKHHYDVFPDLPQKWRDVHQKVLVGEVLSADNDPYERADGEVEWTRWECRPWYEADGSIGGIIVYTEIITERKQIELDLRESAEFNKRIIASSNDCIKVLDLEGNLLSMSSGGQKLLEIDDITIYLNKSWTDFWKGEDNKAAIKAISIAKKGGAGKFTGFCETEKGTPKWWEIIITPINDANGKLKKLLAISRDITERQQADKELQASKDYLGKIINSVVSPIFVKDDKHKFCLVNDALCSLLNLPVEKVIGTTGFEYFPDDQMKVFIAKDREVFETGKENINEELLTDGTGKIRTIVTQKSLYTDPAGNKFLVGVINDITERKQAEEELAKHRDNLEILVKERTAELEEKNVDLQRFHDATVEREFRIKDLNDEIENLKSQLNK